MNRIKHAVPLTVAAHKSTVLTAAWKGLGVVLGRADTRRCEKSLGVATSNQGDAQAGKCSCPSSSRVSVLPVRSQSSQRPSGPCGRQLAGGFGSRSFIQVGA